MLNKCLKRIICMLLMIALVFICACALAEEANGADGMIRVRLTRLGTVSEITFTVGCEYKLTGKDTRLKNGDKVTARAENGTMYVEVNGKRMDMGEKAEFLSCSSGTSGISFRDPELSHVYCGDLSLTASGSVITPILSIYVEDYLYGVVSETMEEGASAEAMKALAIAARSYALCKQTATADSAYDVTDAATDQIFNGYDITRKDAASAVDSTRGQVVCSEGKIAACYTTRSNGGQTESTQNVWGMNLPYSVVKQDPYDAESSSAGVCSVSIKKDGSDIVPDLRNAIIEQIDSQLEEWGLSSGDRDITITSIDSVTPCDPKYENSTLYKTITMDLSVRTVNISTGKPVSCTVSANIPTYGGLENWYGLSINDTDNETVTVAQIGDGYTIMFRRQGHGIGLSRSGAQVMASAYGKTSADILNFYYPGTEIRTLKLNNRSVGTAEEQDTAKSQYALPTLVPRDTAVPTEVPTEAPTSAPTEVPTATPSPTAEANVVFVEEPQDTASVPPLFANLESAPPASSFIAGSAAQQTAGAASTAEPEATVPSLSQETAAPTSTQGGKATPLPDVIEGFDVSFDTLEDIDLNEGDSVLGNLYGEEEPGFTGNTPKATELPDELPADFEDISDTGIETNVSDIDVLGPMNGGSDDDISGAEEGSGVSADTGSMKKPSGDMYGSVSVQEGSSLTIRSEASAESEAVGYLVNEAVVKVLAYDDQWLYVVTSDGTRGFVARSYMVRENATEDVLERFNESSGVIETDDESPETFNGFRSATLDVVVCDYTAETTSNVNIREEPSVESRALLMIAKGETVQVTAYNDEWAFITYGELTGYVYLEYLRKA